MATTGHPSLWINATQCTTPTAPYACCCIGTNVFDGVPWSGTNMCYYSPTTGDISYSSPNCTEAYQLYANTPFRFIITYGYAVFYYPRKNETSGVWMRDISWGVCNPGINGGVPICSNPPFNLSIKPTFLPLLSSPASTSIPISNNEPTSNCGTTCLVGIVVAGGIALCLLVVAILLYSKLKKLEKQHITYSTMSPHEPPSPSYNSAYTLYSQQLVSSEQNRFIPQPEGVTYIQGNEK